MTSIVSIHKKVVQTGAKALRKAAPVVAQKAKQGAEYVTSDDFPKDVKNLNSEVREAIADKIDHVETHGGQHSTHGSGLGDHGEWE